MGVLQHTTHSVRLYFPVRTLSEKDVIITAAHEARHVWQKGYRGIQPSFLKHHGKDGWFERNDIEEDAERYASKVWNKWRRG